MSRCIITKLEELECLLYTTGDLVWIPPLSYDRELTGAKEAAKSLKTLLSTKELISAMRNVLIVETRRQQTNNTVCTRYLFENFKSKEEEYLSDTQVQRLASLTQYWALDPVDGEVLAKKFAAGLRNRLDFGEPFLTVRVLSNDACATCKPLRIKASLIPFVAELFWSSYQSLLKMKFYGFEQDLEHRVL